ncbi:hypothetical protein SSX86_029575 [Deinandra increscens subsp. villosa]|uniref:Uncharacterized protein n=1 Tax=Deinandra increscens subsp. villosa TaxID=3103831 RepID=A0AAP0CAR1_9ASTR
MYYQQPDSIPFQNPQNWRDNDIENLHLPSLQNRRFTTVLDQNRSNSSSLSITKKLLAMEGLTEDERKALRGSKFAPLPSAAPTASRSLPRLAHPGGPLKTNKAAALAKFLERKSQEPSGLSSINPKLVELAVKNAKETVRASNASNSERKIQHVNSFNDSEDMIEDEEEMKVKSTKKKNKKNKKKKNKKQKVI